MVDKKEERNKKLNMLKTKMKFYLKKCIWLKNVYKRLFYSQGEKDKRHNL